MSRGLPAALRSAEVEVPRRRGGTGCLVALLLVVVLLVALYAAAEWVSRLMLRGAAEAAVTRAGVEVDGPLDVSVPGLVIPQFFSGSFDEMTVTADDVTVEGLSADVEVTASDVAIRDRTAGSVTALVSMDAAGVEGVLASSDAFAALGGSPELTIAEPDITASTQLSVFGAEVPLELAVRPSVAEGRLQLAPESITLGEETISQDALSRLPGGLSSLLSGPIPVCLDGSLPRGVTLTGASVADDELVLRGDVDGGILADAELRQPGSCG